MIRKSARKEFDIGKSESDPLISMKMIMTSREALQKTKEKVPTLTPIPSPPIPNPNPI